MSDWYGVRDAACPLSTKGGGGGRAIPAPRGRYAPRRAGGRGGARLSGAARRRRLLVVGTTSNLAVLEQLELAGPHGVFNSTITVALRSAQPLPVVAAQPLLVVDVQPLLVVVAVQHLLVVAVQPLLVAAQPLQPLRAAAPERRRAWARRSPTSTPRRLPRCPPRARRPAAPCSAAPCSAALCSAALCSAALCSAALCSAALRCAARWVLRRAALRAGDAAARVLRPRSNLVVRGRHRLGAAALLRLSASLRRSLYLCASLIDSPALPCARVAGRGAGLRPRGAGRDRRQATAHGDGDGARGGRAHQPAAVRVLPPLLRPLAARHGAQCARRAGCGLRAIDS